MNSLDKNMDSGNKEETPIEETPAFHYELLKYVQGEFGLPGEKGYNFCQRKIDSIKKKVLEKYFRIAN